MENLAPLPAKASLLHRKLHSTRGAMPSSTRAVSSCAPPTPRPLSVQDVINQLSHVGRDLSELTAQLGDSTQLRLALEKNTESKLALEDEVKALSARLDQQAFVIATKDAEISQLEATAAEHAQQQREVEAMTAELKSKLHDHEHCSLRLAAELERLRLQADRRDGEARRAEDDRARKSRELRGVRAETERQIADLKVQVDQLQRRTKGVALTGPPRKHGTAQDARPPSAVAQERVRQLEQDLAVVRQERDALRVALKEAEARARCAQRCCCVNSSSLAAGGEDRSGPSTGCGAAVGRDAAAAAGRYSADELITLEEARQRRRRTVGFFGIDSVVAVRTEPATRGADGTQTYFGEVAAHLDELDRVVSARKSSRAALT